MSPCRSRTPRGLPSVRSDATASGEVAAHRGVLRGQEAVANAPWANGACGFGTPRLQPHYAILLMTPGRLRDRDRYLRPASFRDDLAVCGRRPHSTRSLFWKVCTTREAASEYWSPGRTAGSCPVTSRSPATAPARHVGKDRAVSPRLPSTTAATCPCPGEVMRSISAITGVVRGEIRALQGASVTVRMLRSRSFCRLADVSAVDMWSKS